MKTQQLKLTSLLFCILFASTLAHEYRNAKELSHHYGSSKLISPFHERSSSGSAQQCTYVCKRNETNTHLNLKLIVNSTAELIAIFNTTAQVALVIDVKANLVAVFDGNTGAAIILNIQTQTGVYIAAGVSSQTWLSSDECFASFFQTLTSLQVFLDLNIGVKFTIQNVTKEILTILVQLLGSLSKIIAVQVQQDLKVVITILLNIASSITGLLNGVLKGLLGLVGNTVLHLAGDIFWLVQVLQGLGELVGSITGGLGALIKANVDLNLRVLFSSVNGVEALVNLLLAIVARLSLSVLGNLLNSVDKLVEIIVKLGGGVVTGVTGVFKVLGAIIALVQGKIQIDILIQTLVEFSISRNIKESIEISVYLDGLLKVLELQNSTHSSSDGLTEFISIVTKLVNGNLVLNGLNLSAIISLLVGVVDSVLVLVVSVLIAVGKIVATAIPALLLYIIKLLTTQAGALIVRILIPGIQISGSGNILAIILQNLSLTKIIQLLVGGITNLLKNLPIIGQIYVALSGACHTASNGTVTLDIVLKSSGAASIVKEIEVLIKGAVQVGSSSGSSTTTSKPTWNWPWGYNGSTSVNSSSSSNGSSWSWVLPWGSSSTNVSIQGSGSVNGSGKTNSSNSWSWSSGTQSTKSSGGSWGFQWG